MLPLRWMSHGYRSSDGRNVGAPTAPVSDDGPARRRAGSEVTRRRLGQKATREQHSRLRGMRRPPGGYRLGSRDHHLRIGRLGQGAGLSGYTTLAEQVRRPRDQGHAVREPCHCHRHAFDCQAQRNLRAALSGWCCGTALSGQPTRLG
jgi:hypothetical protein